MITRLARQVAVDVARGALTGWVPRLRLRLHQPTVQISGSVKFRWPRSGRVRIGPGVILSDYTYLVVDESPDSLLSIGSESYVGEFCNIRATGGPVVVGRRVLVAQGVTIVASNYLLTGPGDFISRGLAKGSGVTIEDGAWIGAHSVLLPGSHVGSGSVIGAGSVVRGRIPAGCIATGSPAVVKRSL